MDVKSSLTTRTAQMKPRAQAPKKADAAPQGSADTVDFSRSEEGGWFGASLSVAGGALSIIGGLTDNPVATIGGFATSIAGMGVTAYRHQVNGSLDTAGKVSLVAGAGMSLAGAMILTAPSAAPQPNGPIHQLIDRLGLHGL